MAVSPGPSLGGELSCVCNRECGSLQAIPGRVFPVLGTGLGIPQAATECCCFSSRPRHSDGFPQNTDVLLSGTGKREAFPETPMCKQDPGPTSPGAGDHRCQGLTLGGPLFEDARGPCDSCSPANPVFPGSRAPSFQLCLCLPSSS